MKKIGFAFLLLAFLVSNAGSSPWGDHYSWSKGEIIVDAGGLEGVQTIAAAMSYAQTGYVIKIRPGTYVMPNTSISTRVTFEFDFGATWTFAGTRITAGVAGITFKGHPNIVSTGDSTWFNDAGYWYTMEGATITAPFYVIQGDTSRWTNCQFYISTWKGMQIRGGTGGGEYRFNNCRWGDSLFYGGDDNYGLYVMATDTTSLAIVHNEYCFMYVDSVALYFENEGVDFDGFFSRYVVNYTNHDNSGVCVYNNRGLIDFSYCDFVNADSGNGAVATIYNTGTGGTMGFLDCYARNNWSASGGSGYSPYAIYSNGASTYIRGGGFRGLMDLRSTVSDSVFGALSMEYFGSVGNLGTYYFSGTFNGTNSSDTIVTGVMYPLKIDSMKQVTMFEPVRQAAGNFYIGSMCTKIDTITVYRDGVAPDWEYRIAVTYGMFKAGSDSVGIITGYEAWDYLEDSVAAHIVLIDALFDTTNGMFDTTEVRNEISDSLALAAILTQDEIITGDWSFGSATPKLSWYDTDSENGTSVDTAAIVAEADGTPSITFYGTDGDAWGLTINTSDQASFEGASGGYVFDNDLILPDPGTSANSKIITLRADNTSTVQEAQIFVVYGADPCLRLSAPNDAGTATTMVDIKDQRVVIGTGTASVDYDLFLNGETNDGTITYMEDEDRFDFDNDVDVIADLTAGTISSDAAITVATSLLPDANQGADIGTAGTEFDSLFVQDIAVSGDIPGFQKDSDSTTFDLTKTQAAAAYQPLEATLTDIADGTIDENLVNTANPWADNEIASSATWNNRLDSAAIVTWPDTGAVIVTVSDTTVMSTRISAKPDSGSVAFLAQDETITGNWVNTTSPWADNEIASSATWNNRIDSAAIVTWPDTVSTFVTVSDTTVLSTRISGKADTGQVVFWPDSANELATNYDLSLKLAAADTASLSARVNLAKQDSVVHYLSANGIQMYPAPDSACGSGGLVNFGTAPNIQRIWRMNFSNTDSTWAQAEDITPYNWNGGAVNVKIHWLGAGGTEADSVRFDIAGVCYGNDYSISSATFGSYASVIDQLITVNDEQVTPSVAVTLNNATAGTRAQFQMGRVTGIDNDLAYTATVLGVEITYILNTGE